MRSPGWSPPADLAGSVPGLGARIAVYDSLAAAPLVKDVAASGPRDFIESLAIETYNLSRERGGKVPYAVIREVVENFIHAAFDEVVVSVLDEGNTIRFSDRGPGVVDKEHAFLPGFSTAGAEMKRYIRGVGSGLPIVKECLACASGDVTVEDNLGGGTVVTLSVGVASAHVDAPASAAQPAPQVGPAGTGETVRRRLTTRQKKVLSLAMEVGEVGPTLASREFGVGLSTAHRDLAALERCGLLEGESGGRRRLTPAGKACLDALSG